VKLKHNWVSKVSCNLSQNFEVNWVPLPSTIFFGTPCKQTILDVYNSASCGPE
jgi:hypothetical protein